MSETTDSILGLESDRKNGGDCGTVLLGNKNILIFDKTFFQQHKYSISIQQNALGIYFEM
jgi:hypothetical protein